MPEALERMSPEEELVFLREELQVTDPVQILDRIVGHFGILQTRAGMMISLIALCLTISGFSGHRIAAAGMLPALLLSIGLFLAVVSALLLFAGPLRLRWASTYRHPDGMDARLIAMIRLRNHRTQMYHSASAVLFMGLTSYLSAVVLSLFAGGPV